MNVAIHTAVRAARPWLVLSLLAVAAAALAADLPAPTGRTVLTVSGLVRHTTDGRAAHFDRAQLEAMPQRTLRAHTPWTEGETSFTGPLLRDVLTRVGAHGTTLRGVAINDYEVLIPASDAQTYDVILAVRRDGKPMRVRDRGPVWVIYPWGEHPELRTERYHARSIWQLETLVVE